MSQISEKSLNLESAHRRVESEEHSVAISATDSGSVKVSRVPPGGNYADQNFTKQLKRSSKRKYAKQRYEADHHYDDAVMAFDEPEKKHQSVVSEIRKGHHDLSKYASSGRTVLPSLGQVPDSKELREDRSMITISGTRRKRRHPVRFAGPGEANDSDDAQTYSAMNSDVPSHKQISTFDGVPQRRPPGAGSR